MHFLTNDMRPALHLEDVTIGKIEGLWADINADASLIYENNLSEIFIKNPGVSVTCKSVMETHGGPSNSIRFSDVDEQKFKEIIIKE